MRQRRFPTACLAILAVLALSGGIASAPSVAFARTTSAPDASTITTQLQPGWNMVGWVGPETLSAQVFEELPALRQISAWDAGQQRYRRAWPDQDEALPALTPDRGLRASESDQSCLPAYNLGTGLVQASYVNRVAVVTGPV